jgi:hypothetical protein
MSEQRRNEKEEEKRGEKEREKGRSWDEKWQHDSPRVISIAALLIWGGLVALAGTSNFFDFDWAERGWAVFLLGAGVILILKAIIRAIVPEFRRAIGASLIIGLVLLAVGLFELIGWNWNYMWPVVLIAIGLIILLRGVFRHRK